MQEQLSLRLIEETLKFRQQFDKLKIGFELDMIKFEKSFKDKHQDTIKTLKIQHLDRLIDLGSQVRKIQSRHGSGSEHSSVISVMDGACIEVQNDLNKLVQHLEALMKDLTNEENIAELGSQFEMIQFASDDEVKQSIGTSLGLQQKDGYGITSQQHEITSFCGVTSGSVGGILSPKTTASQAVPQGNNFGRLYNQSLSNQIVRNNNSANQFIKLK